MPATSAGFLVPHPDRDRRQHDLAIAIAKLLRAMDVGEDDKTNQELQIIAEICEEHDLPIEATRVRRQIRSNRSE
jgi:hypothetical protein